MNKRMMIFGFGYSAKALAPRLVDKGWRVSGSTRDPLNVPAIEAMGVKPVLIGRDDLLSALKDATHLLLSAAPTQAGDPLLTMLGELPPQTFPNLRWIGYLSTTGVYGDHQGGWVSETTPLAPTTQRGKMREKAEGAWQDFASQHDVPLSIFRLAGIYGPGRGPFSKIKSGKARRIIKDNQVFSRIHVDDIASVVETALNRPESSGVFNVCDDEAAAPQDVIGFAAELLGLPLPLAESIEDAEMSPMARSFYAESKRVRNDRIKDDLGVVLKYPNYKKGLRALLDD